MGIDFTASNVEASLDALANRNRDYVDGIRNGGMVDGGGSESAIAEPVASEPAEHWETPQEAFSTPVSGTDDSAEVDGGTATEVFAETAKPRRGRRRGPARETHAITVPAELWQEWVEMAERNDTNVSFMIEDVMRRKGRKLYE